MSKRYAILIPLAGISADPERSLEAVKRTLDEESEWVFSSERELEAELKAMASVARLISKESAP